MPFGYVNNPNGRTPGARNKRTTEIWELLEKRGDTDPLDFLSNYVTHGKDDGLRAACANYALPYKHSKRSPTPAPRFVDDPIPIPDFTNIEQAQNFLADIARRSGSGELELQSALDISTLVKNWIISVTAQDELQLKIAKENPQGPQQIHITGGLGPLPGTSIAMEPDGQRYAQEPVLDATSVHPMHSNGHVIEHMPQNVTPSLPQSDDTTANPLETLSNEPPSR